MTLNGAINFSENNDSIIYTMNSPQTGQYCVVMPKSINNGLSMLVDINMKSLFDSLINNTITKEQLIEKINEEYKYVKSSFSDGILVLPMLDANVLGNAVINGDKQKMFDKVKKIGGITSEIYKKLTESGVDKSKIDQKIMIIECNDNDIKFVEWLKGQMPNFVDGIALSQLKANSSTITVGPNSDPFANVNPFTGEATKSESSNDIFGPAENTNTSSQPNNTNVTPTSNNDFFGPISNIQQPTNSDNSTTIFEPTPVNSTKLDSSDAFDSPVSTPNVATENVAPANVSPVSSPEQPVESQTNAIDKKSGGFANLLILFVILVVVTVVSIELGKFLYNTYGV